MASATNVYRNGTILTMDSGGSQAQALAVRGETILAVGSDAEIMALADPHTVGTDLRGRTMLPGFIDGHSHFVSHCIEYRYTAAHLARLSRCRTAYDIRTVSLHLFCMETGCPAGNALYYDLRIFMD